MSKDEKELQKVFVEPMLPYVKIASKLEKLQRIRQDILSKLSQPGLTLDKQERLTKRAEDLMQKIGKLRLKLASTRLNLEAFNRTISALVAQLSLIDENTSPEQVQAFIAAAGFNPSPLNDIPASLAVESKGELNNEQCPSGRRACPH